MLIQDSVSQRRNVTVDILHVITDTSQRAICDCNKLFKLLFKEGDRKRCGYLDEYFE